MEFSTALVQTIFIILLAVSRPKCSSSASNIGDLVINVGFASTDDESTTSIYRQIISGNSSTDTVVIEYSEPGGTLITQLTDYRTQSQIMRVIIPGEEELGQPLFQVVCFVSYFNGDLIPPEAVMKLRQKHPGALRTAEDDQGEVLQECDLSINPIPSTLATISSHLSSLCKDARTTSYTSQQDLQNILNTANNQGDRAGTKPAIASLTTRIKGYESYSMCSNLFGNSNSVDDEQDDYNLSEPIKDRYCQCTRKVWLNWYPCALKYCKNKDGEGEHRCGIRTCKKLITYQWATPFRFCISNDDVV